MTIIDPLPEKSPVTDAKTGRMSLDWQRWFRQFVSNVSTEDTGFIKKDGTVAFTGNQSHGGYNITNVGTVDGVDISAHAADVNAHHAQTHTIASHDTTATGANLTTLTNDSMADALHRHSELSASDGSPNPAVSVDATGNTYLGGATDRSKFDTDGTLVFEGAATVHDDLNFDPVRSGGPVATRPAEVTINNCLYVEFTSGNNKLCGSCAEIPHKAKLSQTLYPHLHCFLKSGESAGTTGVTFTLYWQLRQDSATTQGSTTLAVTSAQLTANPHEFFVEDATGFAGPTELGGQLALTIARTAGDAEDVVVTTYGVHYEIDQPGSRTRSSK